ncbi:MAG TPA: thioredoxin domain-containing protein [Mycobacteriales bacterium]|nr:thioredoxin domain-containing protein [Mycobacteriales bacterium]
MPNRLKSATSPYLLQHAQNPVDWWEWSDEAFAEARRRDVPVLLSVGYAACHWCHVMAHESFEDAAVAALMNANFVCIKVDREERPDVDAVYMEATQAMTGQGGWPMTAFVTPDRRPFFCGTYFPPQPRPGIPSFTQLLDAVAESWRDRRDELVSVGDEVTARLGAAADLPVGEGISPESGATAMQLLRESFDSAQGGFGGAPKFPPSMLLEFLLRYARRTGDTQAFAMMSRTGEAMARGGIYDQLAGGFARYSVDGGWVVPHFEKMLYDNALLLRVYGHWWRQDGSELARRIAVETAEFLLRDLRTAEGGFASALDADTDGVEGATYVWSPEQLVGTLGEDDGAWAAHLFAVTEAGTFEHGTSTLQLPADPDDGARWESVRQRLFAARSQRPQPERDDKVVTSWNGLAIAALADVGALLRQDRYVAAAVGAGELIWDLHQRDGRLLRTSRDGRPGRSHGVLEDYANAAEGFLALHQATGDGRWLTRARILLDTALRHFADPSGGFFDTADDAETLIHRPGDPTDGPTPSGAAALASALLTAWALTDLESYREPAEAIATRLRPLVEHYPRAAGHIAATTEAFLAGPRQIAVVGAPEERAGLEAVARADSAAGTVVVAGAPDAPDVPLLASRPLVGGAAAAYVCRNFVCAAPVTTTDDLRAALGAR